MKYLILLISVNTVVIFLVSSLFSYVRSELTRGYMQECDELLYSEKHRRVSTFMQTPRELEKVRVVIKKTVNTMYSCNYITV